MRTRLMLLATAAVIAVLPAEAAQSQRAMNGPKLELRDLVATVDIKVVPGTTGIRVALDGDQDLIDRVTYEQKDGTATVAMQRIDGGLVNERPERLRMIVTIAPGTSLAIDNQVGDLMAGDLDAPVAIMASASGDMRIGRVTTAAVQIVGASDITIGDVGGHLAVQSQGSGDFKSGRAGATALSIAGSGSVDVSSVSGSLGIKSEGSGDTMVGSVEGAVQIQISGSGSIEIGDGRANPFAASLSGSGSVLFGGTASNTQVAMSGSGKICVGAYDGPLAVAGDHFTSGPNCRP